MALVERLRNFRDLAEFTDAELRLLANFMEEKEYKDGEQIIDEKGHSTSLLFVMSGKVIISRKLSANTMLTTTLDEHAIFGEVAFADRLPRTAGATALGTTLIGSFGYEHFEIIKRQDAVFGMKLLMQLLKGLAQKFRQVNNGLDLLVANASKP